MTREDLIQATAQALHQRLKLAIATNGDQRWDLLIADVLRDFARADDRIKDQRARGGMVSFLPRHKP